MALTPETGAGLASADSYASTAQADAYHALRGNTAWAALTDERKEQCLRLGTEHMSAYAGQWKGERVTSTQALDWPRFGVVANGYELDYQTIPAPIVNACIVLALKSSAAELAPDLGAQKQSVKVGPIETTYFAGTRQAVKYQAVENMLAPYFGSGAGLVKVIRA